MSESEMVERAARALARLNSMSQDEADATWKNYVDDVRKVIEAMREPTEAMIEAAERTPGQMRYSDVWRAMIAEALKCVD